MVAAPPPPSPPKKKKKFMEDLKISDQNNWRGPEQKIRFGGGAKFKWGPKILGGPMNPNDAMVVVLKDILLCLLGFRFIYIVYIS